MPPEAMNTGNAGKVELILRRETLRLNPDKAVRGTIFFQQGSIDFPTNDWSDFVVVVLEWWLRALMPIIRGEEATAELFFMEGPYQVNVGALSSTMIVMHFFDRSRPEFFASGQTQQSLSDFIHNICDASDAVVNWVKRIDLKNRDLDRLHTTLSEMRAQIERVNFRE
jgi:hypothetical protein